MADLRTGAALCVLEGHREAVTAIAVSGDGRRAVSSSYDDDAIRRSRVYVDTRIGAPKEAGDIVQPLKKGILKKTGIRGDLYDLCRGKAKGRTKDSEITLFKSVGASVEDLAAAMLVWKSLA